VSVRNQRKTRLHGCPQAQIRKSPSYSGRVYSIYRALTFQNPKADGTGKGAGGLLDLTQVQKNLITKMSTKTVVGA
jgi:hypothetical protein